MAIDRMKQRLNGHGGVIVIDREGNIGKAFSTVTMAWASIKDNQLHFGTEENECNVIDIAKN